MNHYQSKLCHYVFIGTPFGTYSDTNDRVSGHGERVSVPVDVIVMQQRNHSGHRGEGDISHAVGLLDVDYGFAHLLIDKEGQLSQF